MFYYAYSFNQPLNEWNVGMVKNMQLMFYEASSFNQPLSSWNVGKVTNMDAMLEHASAFNHSLNLWSVDNVTSMRSARLATHTPHTPPGLFAAPGAGPALPASPACTRLQ